MVYLDDMCFSKDVQFSGGISMLCFRLPPSLTILLTSCKPSWDYKSQAGYQLFLICAMYVLPFLLMGYTYTRIARTLWSNAIPTESSKTNTYTVTTHKRKRVCMCVWKGSG